MTSIEEIRQALIDSQLMSEENVDQHLKDWQSQAVATATGDDFVSWLVQGELLTEFQGEAISAGHTGPFMLGPYRVYEQVAASRYGGVFRAVHEEFKQPVSLKVYPQSLGDDEEMLARIGREVRIAAELDHPNVIRSFQMGKLGDIYYLALEDLRGETLAARLRRDEHLPFEEACQIIDDIAGGLVHLHSNEVIHRDIRPANIWLTEGGGAKLMEFGAALDAFAHLDELDEEDEDDDDDEEVISYEAVVGQYDYLPPEQVCDPDVADEGCDIYALGCTFYHCLTGRPPFVHPNPVRQALQHVFHQQLPLGDLVEGIPVQLDDTIAGMIAKDSAQRFRKAQDVVFALEPFVGKKSEAEEAEELKVVEVSDEYLSWARSSHASQESILTEDAVGVTPQLTGFLDWMTAKDAKKKKK